MTKGSSNGRGILIAATCVGPSGSIGTIGMSAVSYFTQMFTYFVEKFKASDYCPVLATRGKFLMFCKMTSEWL
jgi:hypothetical protein